MRLADALRLHRFSLHHCFLFRPAPHHTTLLITLTAPRISPPPPFPNPTLHPPPLFPPPHPTHNHHPPHSALLLPAIYNHPTSSPPPFPAPPPHALPPRLRPPNLHPPIELLLQTLHQRRPPLVI